MKIFGIVRSAAQLIADTFTAGDLRQPNLTLRGNIAVESLITGPVGPVVSVAADDDDAVVAAQTVALGITENYIYNGVAGAWNRMQAVPDNADGQAALAGGTPGVIARLQGWNGATFDRIRSQADNADGVAVTAQGHLSQWSHNGLFNGTSWDRERGAIEGTILASAVRNATNSSADFTNYNHNAISIFFNVTAVPGVQTVTLLLQGKDPVSGTYTNLLTTAAAAGIGFTTLNGNIFTVQIDTQRFILPRTWRVNIVHSGAGNFTYSVGYTLNK